jgi:hypothetical protein
MTRLRLVQCDGSQGSGFRAIGGSGFTLSCLGEVADLKV